MCWEGRAEGLLSCPAMGVEGRGQIAMVVCARVCAFLTSWVAGLGREQCGAAHPWRSLLIVCTWGNSVLTVDCVSSGFSSFALSVVLPGWCASLAHLPLGRAWTPSAVGLGRPEQGRQLPGQQAPSFSVLMTGPMYRVSLCWACSPVATSPTLHTRQL